MGNSRGLYRSYTASVLVNIIKDCLSTICGLKNIYIPLDDKFDGDQDGRLTVVVGHPVVADPDFYRGSNTGHRGRLAIFSRHPEEDDGAAWQMDGQLGVRHVGKLKNV